MIKNSNVILNKFKLQSSKPTKIAIIIGADIDANIVSVYDIILGIKNLKYLLEDLLKHLETESKD